MNIALAPILVALVGLLLWLLTAKASEVGKILFAAGTLVALLESGHWLVHL